MSSLAQGNTLGMYICHCVIALKGQKYLAQGIALWFKGIVLWSHGDTP